MLPQACPWPAPGSAVRVGGAASLERLAEGLTDQLRHGSWLCSCFLLASHAALFSTTKNKVQSDRSHNMFGTYYEYMNDSEYEIENRTVFLCSFNVF